MKLLLPLLLLGGSISAVVAGPLTDEDRAEWIKLYEEEILAHDLYVELGKAHPEIMPFQNIPHSEAAHRDVIAEVLEKEGIVKPAPPAGQRFATPGLDALYDRLLAKGRKSEKAACKVGVGFEETDIADLRAAQERFPAAKTMLAQLEFASGNHLRAFHRNLVARGGKYKAAELEQADLESILAGKGPEGVEGCGACAKDGGCKGDCAAKAADKAKCEGNCDCAGKAAGKAAAKAKCDGNCNCAGKAAGKAADKAKCEGNCDCAGKAAGKAAAKAKCDGNCNCAGKGAGKAADKAKCEGNCDCAGKAAGKAADKAKCDGNCDCAGKAAGAGHGKGAGRGQGKGRGQGPPPGRGPGNRGK